MNRTNWARVYSTTELYKAEILKSVLEDEGIQSVLVDKKDTVYGGSFGEIEIYVQRENVIRAKRAIEKKQL